MSEYTLDRGVWYHTSLVIDNGGEDSVDAPVLITSVPVNYLLEAWEDLVHELSGKERALLDLKEFVNQQGFEFEQHTDYKALYGKNNADVRKHHLKQELSDVFDEIQALELGINWIKQYIPLLREAIRVKSNPVVLDSPVNITDGAFNKD